MRTKDQLLLIGAASLALGAALTIHLKYREVALFATTQILCDDYDGALQRRNVRARIATDPRFRGMETSDVYEKLDAWCPAISPSAEAITRSRF